MKSPGLADSGSPPDLVLRPRPLHRARQAVEGERRTYQERRVALDAEAIELHRINQALKCRMTQVDLQAEVRAGA